jgi:hypothetical protein
MKKDNREWFFPHPSSLIPHPFKGSPPLAVRRHRTPAPVLEGYLLEQTDAFRLRIGRLAHFFSRETAASSPRPGRRGRHRSRRLVSSANAPRSYQVRVFLRADEAGPPPGGRVSILLWSVQ